MGEVVLVQVRRPGLKSEGVTEIVLLKESESVKKAEGVPCTPLPSLGMALAPGFPSFASAERLVAYCFSLSMLKHSKA